jgi:hypothetical protein
MKQVLVSDSMAPEFAEILGNAPGVKVDVKTAGTVFGSDVLEKFRKLPNVIYTDRNVRI